MSTLTKSGQRVALNERPTTTISPLPGNLLRYERTWRSAKDRRTDRCAAVEKTNLGAIEGPCRGEGCAKLLTLRIVDISPQAFYGETILHRLKSIFIHYLYQL